MRTHVHTHTYIYIYLFIFSLQTLADIQIKLSQMEKEIENLSSTRNSLQSEKVKC